VQAIQEAKLIRLRYKGSERIVEPHDYGIQNGIVKLLAFQLAGVSSGRLPAWRSLHEKFISDVQILDQTFAGGRGAPSGKHQTWDRLFIRVRPAKRKS
jgi:hypothetical protein